MKTPIPPSSNTQSLSVAGWSAGGVTVGAVGVAGTAVGVAGMAVGVAGFELCDAAVCVGVTAVGVTAVGVTAVGVTPVGGTPVGVTTLAGVVGDAAVGGLVTDADPHAATMINMLRMASDDLAVLRDCTSNLQSSSCMTSAHGARRN
jgi:hypothetical protein